MRLRDLRPAGLLAAAGLGVLLALNLAPRPGRPVLFLFPPDMAAAQAFAHVAAAGWRPVTMAAGVVLAAPDRADPGRPAGVWLTLDALGLRGCR